jgi:hypothetical protein
VAASIRHHPTTCEVRAFEGHIITVKEERRRLVAMLREERDETRWLRPSSPIGVRRKTASPVK